MVKVKTKIDKKVQISLSKKRLFVALVLTIMGVIGIIAYTVLTIAFDYDVLNRYLLLVIPFGLGFAMIALIWQNIKKINGNEFINEYEFNSEFLNISTTKNNEVIGTQKVYYKDIFKVKENKSYIFIYINQASVFVIDKTCVKADEIKEIRNLLKLKVD